jgi:hypothetical protein
MRQPAVYAALALRTRNARSCAADDPFPSNVGQPSNA